MNIIYTGENGELLYDSETEYCYWRDDNDKQILLTDFPKVGIYVLPDESVINVKSPNNIEFVRKHIYPIKNADSNLGKSSFEEIIETRCCEYDNICVSLYKQPFLVAKKMKYDGFIKNKVKNAYTLSIPCSNGAELVSYLYEFVDGNYGINSGMLLLPINKDDVEFRLIRTKRK